ncbi:transposase [Aurantimonas sp. C2-6-R+9]|nr:MULTISPECIES: transposase [unclassified Aurantimonas]MEC5293794.1 transposase [Aurantimonas sp. C2-3-R2]MEC5383706.1 transposase [Aurantimonas sp. C2-6-R+9]MEC5414846.1 transposase [Aurantimonas sp. C2-4-R8]
MTGRAEAKNFSSYHQLLNRARWDSRAMARRLLVMIIDRLVPDGPVVIGMDDTIERRWGRRITARGIYRDPVRSSHGHFVKASGLRWLSFMVLDTGHLGRRREGPASADPARPLGAFRPPAWPQAQDADRLGSPRCASALPLVARPRHRLRGRQQLRRP